MRPVGVLAYTLAAPPLYVTAGNTLDFSALALPVTLHGVFVLLRVLRIMAMSFG